MPTLGETLQETINLFVASNTPATSGTSVADVNAVRVNVEAAITEIRAKIEDDINSGSIPLYKTSDPFIIDWIDDIVDNNAQWQILWDDFTNDLRNEGVNLYVVPTYGPTDATTRSISANTIQS